MGLAPFSGEVELEALPEVDELEFDKLGCVGVISSNPPADPIFTVLSRSLTFRS